jgi:hypothetical protein
MASCFSSTLDQVGTIALDKAIDRLAVLFHALRAVCSALVVAQAAAARSRRPRLLLGRQIALALQDQPSFAKRVNFDRCST